MQQSRVVSNLFDPLWYLYESWTACLREMVSMSHTLRAWSIPHERIFVPVKLKSWGGRRERG